LIALLFHVGRHFAVQARRSQMIPSAFSDSGKPAHAVWSLAAVER
jgi:hypothetical protein